MDRDAVERWWLASTRILRPFTVLTYLIPLLSSSCLYYVFCRVLSFLVYILHTNSRGVEREARDHRTIVSGYVRRRPDPRLVLHGGPVRGLHVDPVRVLEPGRSAVQGARVADNDEPRNITQMD
jgi:hypothetical protein